MPLMVAVLADDLTGAAEIAALGARRGRRVLVVTSAREAAGAIADLIVVDTDTRLDPPAEAARRSEVAATTPAIAAATFLFKKTDSVLRGPVRAELEAIARARGFNRVLLVPANPALGRIVERGRYFVQGRPVVETAFANDPHHPVHSSDVLAMLGPGVIDPVFSATPDGPMPERGIVIGDATNSGDLTRWARRVGLDTLPAGAAGFFAALLENLGWHEQSVSAPPPLRGPVLVISGTKSPAPPPSGRAGPILVFAVPNELIASTCEPNRSPWFGAIADALLQHQRAAVSSASLVPSSPDTSEKIRHLLADLVRALHARRAFAHLVIEGGATASTIVRQLGWSQLAVTHEWAQGIVTLQPTGNDRVDLTIKPGSYAWPVAFWKLRFAADRLPSHGGAA